MFPLPVGSQFSIVNNRAIISSFNRMKKYLAMFSTVYGVRYKESNSGITTYEHNAIECSNKCIPFN